MKVFLDTNILVDLIADRKPFSKHAIEIFKRSEEKQLELFTSSHSIVTTHYLLKKYLDERQLREILLSLLDLLTVIPADSNALRNGLRSNHKDFEDAVQIMCASTISRIDFIITRNPKDFRTSEIKVMTPDEFFLNQ